MPHFLCRLNPPRPTFAVDMTDEELALMGEHGVHWSGHLERGDALLFGLVADPAGPWGAAVVEADDEAAARGLTDGDPVIVRGEGFSYDVLAMPNVVVAPRA